MCRNWVLFLLTAMLFPVLTVAQEDSITVKGTILFEHPNQASKVMLLVTNIEGKRQTFTGKLIEGRFTVRVPKQEVVAEAQLRAIGDTPPDVMQRPLDLFLGKNDLVVAARIEELDLGTVSGDQENNMYDILRQSKAGLSREVKALFAPILAQQVNSESPEGKEIMSKMSALLLKESALDKAFIAAHPDAYASLFLLYRLQTRYTSDDYAQAFAALSPRYHHTKAAQDIQHKITKESITAKGTLAIDFKGLTMEQKEFALSDLKGRVVLLDFWGSWCGPCRASMPHLKTLYAQYKDKGFEVVGIAQERGKTLEESSASWKKAIDELGIHWVNILNNAGKEQLDIVKAYGISGFPTKILLDAQGNILLRVTSSGADDAIDAALRSVYGL